MRLTPRRLVIFVLSLVTVFIVLTILTPRSDDPHRPRANIKRRRLDNIYNTEEDQIKNEESQKINNQPENPVNGLEDKTRGRNLGSPIDWHNYTAMRLDSRRTGRGELGPVELAEEEKSSLSMGKFGYSNFVSDLVSLDRANKDIRHPLCMKKLYHENLPDTSIVMPFHNEAPSVLLRYILLI